jgi:hypothetical protein
MSHEGLVLKKKTVVMPETFIVLITLKNYHFSALILACGKGI